MPPSSVQPKLIKVGFELLHSLHPDSIIAKEYSCFFDPVFATPRGAQELVSINLGEEFASPDPLSKPK